MSEGSVKLVDPEDAGKDPLIVMRSDVKKETTDGQTSNESKATNTEETKTT